MLTAAQPALTRLNVNGAWYEALFASALQPSDSPTADMVAQAISRALRQFGVHGSAGWMAQEFGDHPDAAASRMRWVRQFARMAAGGRWTGPVTGTDREPRQLSDPSVKMVAGIPAVGREWAR